MLFCKARSSASLPTSVGAVRGLLLAVIATAADASCQSSSSSCSIATTSNSTVSDRCCVGVTTTTVDAGTWTSETGITSVNSVSYKPDISLATVPGETSLLDDSLLSLTLATGADVVTSGTELGREVIAGMEADTRVDTGTGIKAWREAGTRAAVGATSTGSAVFTVLSFVSMLIIDLPCTAFERSISGRGGSSFCSLSTV